jgi:cytochrome c peroxidase
MIHQRTLIPASIVGIAVAAAVTTLAAGPLELSPKEQLGKALFFDANLSTPVGQACAACHGPEVGFTGTDAAVNAAGAVYEGAVSGRFGNRKPPASAYAGDSPVFHLDAITGNFVGGMFWDGRATGLTLGDPLAEQAQGPFLNPLEQNNASSATVVAKVAASAYASLFEQVWGSGSLSPTNVSLAYERIARSIAAYERSKEVNPFNSKFDAYLDNKAKLTQQEADGFQLFLGKGKCANCHNATPGPSSERPLFTDFTFDNPGIPKNPANPFYTMPPEFNPDGTNWIDQGLGGFLAKEPDYAQYADANLGKHKVPTLRNVDKRPNPGFVKAYGHNGYFKSLKEIVHFYNTRDVVAAHWPSPEEPLNVNTAEMGNLGLTDAEEEAIVAFLQTLTDGYTEGPALAIARAVKVSFVTRTGVQYQLQRSGSAQGPWENVGVPFAGDGATTERYFDAEPTQAQFYRAEIVTP